MNKTIIVSGVNIPPQEKADEELQKLGDGWRIVSAITTATVFGHDLEKRVPGQSGVNVPLHHCVYTTTIALESK